MAILWIMPCLFLSLFKELHTPNGFPMIHHFIQISFRKWAKNINGITVNLGCRFRQTKLHKSDYWVGKFISVIAVWYFLLDICFECVTYFDSIENSKNQKLIFCRAFPKTLSLMRRDKILWKLRGYTTLPEQKVISSQIRSTNVNQLLLGTKI